ncbi:ABC-2 type transport system permease protein [Haloarcula vallismortis]|uniref:ABC-2 type transporter n=2 Tax=Haloarcula vallismortis TaxID=28442 RepID=M0JK74_HALVA|nr:ABC transporter permease [Haloarcula vallismortis]EMA08080.1 ABC-2 type transporter [Haloarcula vallismortis ATCC 29715]SDX30652.1 ABC-2 type transport system permease protein [Haloarcula vallismortis]
MSLPAVIRKDFNDAIRSGTFLATTLLFVLVAGFWAAIQHVPLTASTSDVPTSTLALLNSMGQPMSFFVPLLGLGISYAAIAGERDSGSIKLLLSLPNSRRDVILGKFIGRCAVLTIAILSGYFVVAVFALFTYESFAAVKFVLYTILTVFYGAVYVAIGIGFSSIMRSQYTAVVGAGGLYILFQLGWDVVTAILQVITVGYTPPDSGAPPWLIVVHALNPTAAVGYAARAIIPTFDEIMSYPVSASFYPPKWAGFAILGAWLVLSLGFGYIRFQSADIM